MLPRYGGCHNTNVPFYNFSFSLRKKLSTDTLVNDSLPSKKKVPLIFTTEGKMPQKSDPKGELPRKPKGRMVPFKKFKLYLRLNMMECIINLEKLAWQLRKMLTVRRCLHRRQRQIQSPVKYIRWEFWRK